MSHFAQPWPAPAKLNLFLHITGRRSDGYHELQTLFQFLDYGDSLWFEPDSQGKIRRIEGNEAIPEADDLVLKAARLLANETACRQGVSIRIQKRLPTGGGVGGGSSDAATTLVALNRLWGTGLDQAQLISLGLTLGADVPVFIRGVASWAEGIGDQLTPAVEMGYIPDENWFIVLFPGVCVSTAKIFTHPELTRDGPRITIADFVSGQGENHLQTIVMQMYPEVAEAVNWLSRHRPAHMTGSGACVFAACPSQLEAQAILEELPPAWSGFVARGCNTSPLIKRLEETA